jgi:putative membrane protein insertion efficiency factor
MKKFTIMAINIYQRTIAVVLFNLGLKGDCRFSPTCSEYAKLSISQKGIFKGSYLSAIRLLKCQPFYKGN